MRRRILSAIRSPMPSLAALLAVIVILPPYVERGFDVLDIPGLNVFILTHSIRQDATHIFPAVNLVGILALGAVLFASPRAARPFSGYLAFAYVISAFLQNVSLTEQHGLAISTSTFLLTMLVAASWLKVASFPGKTEPSKVPRLRPVLLVPVALVAIWQPVNTTTMLPDFALQGFLVSGSFLTFCMTSTVALSVLLMHYPNVDTGNLRITSAVGLLIGIGNLWLEWIHLPALLWIGVLHVPLVVLSALGLYLSARLAKLAAAQQLAEADPAG